MKNEKEFIVICFNYQEKPWWYLWAPEKDNYQSAKASLFKLKEASATTSFRVVHSSFSDCLELFEEPTPEKDQAYYERLLLR